MDLESQTNHPTSTVTHSQTKFTPSQAPSKALKRILHSLHPHSFHLVMTLVFFYRNIYTIIFSILFAILIKSRPHPHPLTAKTIKPFVLSLCFLLLTLEIETVAGYLVSYFDVNKYNYTPEEDYGYQILSKVLPWWNGLFEKVSVVVKIPGADNYMVVLLLWALLGVLRKVRFNRISILGWGAIFFKGLGWTRLIRVIAFSSTLMPNPQLHCFESHFRNPENTWQMVKDMMTPRFGGCNDLVISGHTLFIAMGLWILRDAVKGWSVKVISLVTPIVLMNIIMLRNHYTVDVVLGVIVSKLVWDRERLMKEEYIKEVEEIEEKLEREEMISEMRGLSTTRATEREESHEVEENFKVFEDELKLSANIAA